MDWHDWRAAVVGIDLGLSTGSSDATIDGSRRRLSVAELRVGDDAAEPKQSDTEAMTARVAIQARIELLHQAASYVIARKLDEALPFVEEAAASVHASATQVW